MFTALFTNSEYEYDSLKNSTQYFVIPPLIEIYFSKVSCSQLRAVVITLFPIEFFFLRKAFRLSGSHIMFEIPLLTCLFFPVNTLWYVLDYYLF